MMNVVKVVGLVVGLSWGCANAQQPTNIIKVPFGAGPSCKVGDVGDFRHMSDTYFNSRVRDIISEDEMLCTLGQPRNHYFILRKYPTAGLADDEVVNLKGQFKCVTTKKYNGKTYFVLEPVKVKK